MKNGDAASDPYIVADSDGFCPLIASVSFNWVCAVTGCIDAHVRSDEAVIPDIVILSVAFDSVQHMIFHISLELLDSDSCTFQESCFHNEE